MKIESNVTQLSNLFIDEYLPKAKPAYVSVYLYTLRHSKSDGLTNAELAKRLDMLEGDVAQAWRHWEKEGLVALHPDGTLEFLPVLPKTQPPKAPLIPSSRPPGYSPEELSIYMEKSALIKSLFTSAEEHLGKLLSHQDMSILFSLYDWLGLPPEVIELLLAYCVQKGHRNLSYIEKVGISWAEEGILTVSRAQEYIRLRTQGYPEILRAFGLSGRFPVPTEEAYIQKWQRDYRLPLDVICAACEKTVIQTGKASFPYADKILTTWRDAKVSSLADIQRLEEGYALAKQAKKEIPKPSINDKPVKKNRFVNYEQRQWDFAKLEKLERELRRSENES